MLEIIAIMAKFRICLGYDCFLLAIVVRAFLLAGQPALFTFDIGLQLTEAAWIIKFLAGGQREQVLHT